MFMISIILLVSTLPCLSLTSDYYKGKVIALKQINYQRAFVDFPYVVLAFQSRECDQSTCHNFTQYFRKAAELTDLAISATNRTTNSNSSSSPLIQFCKLSHEKNPKPFKDLQVEFTPHIRMYHKGEDMGYRFDDVFEYEDAQVLSRWVLEKVQGSTLERFRVDGRYHEDRTYAVLVGCGQDKRMGQFNQARLRDNRNQYLCSDDGNVLGNQYPLGTILLIRNNTITQTFIQGDIFSWVRRFESGPIRQLNTYTIHLIFSQNLPAFILLTHLDAQSTKALQQFNKISSQLLHSDNSTLNSVLFIHSHIDDDLQQHVKMRSWVGAQHKKYPYPHLTFVVGGGNRKYHMDHFKAERMEGWVQNAIAGSEKPFKKSQKFAQQLNPQNVFESIGYDNLIALYNKQPFPELILYVLSSYVDQHLLKLNEMVQQTGFPAHARNFFLKISHTNNDMLEGMEVRELPQLVLVNSTRGFEYMRDEHTVENMKRWLEDKMEGRWIVDEVQGQITGLGEEDALESQQEEL